MFSQERKHLYENTTTTNTNDTANYTNTEASEPAAAAAAPVVADDDDIPRDLVCMEQEKDSAFAPLRDIQELEREISNINTNLHRSSRHRSSSNGCSDEELEQRNKIVLKMLSSLLGTNSREE